MMASSQSYDFSSSHVRMWELDHEEGCCCSVAQSCLTVYKPMDCSTVLGFPVLHHLPELAQTYVHWVIMGPLWCSLKVSDAIQPCHLLLPPSLPSVFPRIRVISVRQLFISDGQSMGASALASVLPMNIQGRHPLGLTGLITLLSKGLSRVFSNTATQNHQFFSTQSSLWCTWLLYTSHLYMTTGKP